MKEDDELRHQGLFGNSNSGNCVSFANTAMGTPATPAPLTPSLRLFETPTSTRLVRGETHFDSITKEVQQLRVVLLRSQSTLTYDQYVSLL